MFPWCMGPNCKQIVQNFAKRIDVTGNWILHLDLGWIEFGAKLWVLLTKWSCERLESYCTFLFFSCFLHFMVCSAQVCRAKWVVFVREFRRRRCVEGLQEEQKFVCRDCVNWNNKGKCNFEHVARSLHACHLQLDLDCDHDHFGMWGSFNSCVESYWIDL